ncbi:DUF948 domain-containing protein [Bacillus sp. REN16]|uniref:DUF948 domain-containing protein n=1 Tax=Bacillus sp. REN16 TaxID=2887296 RepID=UPI001E4EB364|nr:DUF948 domain-containing protein [Bacillus sp. REN16]MCC3357988.1 DUF948 domain-containing protein [Bacillus sp. REN16]
MILIVYISVAVIAVAFLILVIYLSRTLRSLQITLDNVAGTLSGLEKQMEGVTSETTALLHKTNKLAEDIQQKSESLNTVVYAVKDVGTSLQRFNQSVGNVTEEVAVQLEKNKTKISQVVQVGNAVIEMWDKWKDKKQKHDKEISN